jgi:arylsulfatase A-like enzyme
VCRGVWLYGRMLFRIARELPIRTLRMLGFRRVTVVGLIALSFAVSLQAKDPRPKPNVIVIVSDDMGYADVGFQGCKDIPTPNLDALAKSGVRFTSGYVSGTYCSPTRAGLLTGRYQTRFGHEFNPVGDAGMPVTEKTFAQRFHAAGYKTGLVGKWHLGHRSEMHPTRRGFDEFFGFLGGGNTYFREPLAKSRIQRGHETVVEKEYLTDALGREAVNFIDRHKSEPFFLYLAFNAPHMPLEADKERLKKFPETTDPKRRPYAAMVSALDDAVGRVQAKLRDINAVQDTLIVFFSDNGGPSRPTWPGTTANGSINAPLRGSKRQTLEGGVRVPFVMAWPGHLPQGIDYHQPVIQLDVLPTALTAAGIPIDSKDKLDGVNLLPFLTEKASGAPHEALFWRFGEDWAIRKGDWKLAKYYDVAPGAKDDLAPKLYNLAEDIGEANDLTAKHPEKVKELTAAWQAWNRDNVAPLWAVNIRKE